MKESDKSRTSWAPLFLNIGEQFSLVIIWKNYRGALKIYSESNKKDSIFGKVKKCVFSDENFLVTDDLSTTIKLKSSLLDVSITGGNDKLANRISSLKSKGELSKISEYLTVLGNINEVNDLENEYNSYKVDAKETALIVGKLEPDLILGELNSSLK